MSTMKRISFLATGNEIIEGDVLDTNSHYFAKVLNANGADIYQHIQVSDRRTEILQALQYLLMHSDVVLITGGLGPTSDDNTRFVVADVVGKELVFDDASWEAIVARFKKYQITVTDSNKQQALFPAGLVIYPNPNGTANGSYLAWKDKHIFMLPGPPKECIPLFEKHVLPTLQGLKLFSKADTYRWLTLGLVEASIAEEVDVIAKPYGIETGYRWSYPYLEIKLKQSNGVMDPEAVKKVESLIADYIVSVDGKTALESMQECLDRFGEEIYIVDDIAYRVSGELISHPKLVFMDSNNDRFTDNKNRCMFYSSAPVSGEHVGQGVITFTCHGYLNNTQVYENQLTVPCRDSGIIEFAKAYAAWQLKKYMTSVKKV